MGNGRRWGMGLIQPREKLERRNVSMRKRGKKIFS
jgi:hypothetical protein